MVHEFVDGFSWYFLHVRNEKRAVDSLKDSIRGSKVESCFDKFFIPMCAVAEHVTGSEKVSERNIYPGYILVRVKLNNDSWYLVKSNRYVVNFLGGESPSVVSDEEVERIRLASTLEKTNVLSAFEIGDLVAVMDGPFAGFEGKIESVDHKRSRVRVGVMIFRRVTFAELEMRQIKRLV